jgi:hypothetical protein
MNKGSVLYKSYQSYVPMSMFLSQLPVDVMEEESLEPSLLVYASHTTTLCIYIALLAYEKAITFIYIKAVEVAKFLCLLLAS